MKSKLSLDLSDLPALIQPSPPSNTLLITNLDDTAIFEPENLQNFRDTINQHVPIHSWAPLKSFRRIIASFYDIPSATFIKQTLDGEVIMDCQVRVYFGAATDTSPTSKHLEAPKLQKQFFISPPPSPPHDWAIRNEGPPNKEVHAEDLASALAKLHAISHEHDMDYNLVEESNGGRVRSGSTTLVYHPSQHGSDLALPAISVEDTTIEAEVPDSPEDYSPMEDVVNAPILHTSRPPVELMEQ
jgi:hypothetical protein